MLVFVDDGIQFALVTARVVALTLPANAGRRETTCLCIFGAMEVDEIRQKSR